jgi:hypothetical protein
VRTLGLANRRRAIGVACVRSSRLTFAIRRNSRVSGDPLDEADTGTVVPENADNSSVTAMTKVDVNDRSLWRRGRYDVLVGVGIVAGIVWGYPDARIAITFGLTV